jgi:hypothetical protein
MIENRILRYQITDRVSLTDGDRETLAHIGYKLGKQALGRPKISKDLEEKVAIGQYVFYCSHVEPE